MDKKTQYILVALIIIIAASTALLFKGGLRPETEQPIITPSPKTELEKAKSSIPPSLQETKLRLCPSEWIDNQMPGTVDEDNPPRQYFIVDGERRELEEFDTGWIQNNCNLEKQVAQ